MSSGDDTRILNMRINNKEFLKGTGDSLKAIDTLNKGIDNAGKGKSMQGLSSSVDTVKNRFSALQVVGVTALATIANKAVNAGLSFAKSFTVGPILDGFREYEKLLTSTQTIVANTGKELENFDKGERIKIVGSYLDALNDYSDQTIYNFGQMAENIGKFTAAGVKLQPSVDAIKGMANSAALFGSSSEQLNTAMYQVSQALASGTIKLMDWNSLVNAGMGGENMQMALKATARTFDGLGGKMDAAIKKNGSFRESLKEGWLSADVFTKAMKVMGGQALNATSSVKSLEKLGLAPATVEAIKAGGAFKFTTKDIQNLKEQGFDKATIGALEMGKSVAFTAKQLEGMGYSKEAAKDLARLSADAIESATKIKTFTQLIDVVKESIGSGWAQIFRRLFGDLEKAGKLWTTVGNKITGALDKIFYSTDLALGQWEELGGYEKLWGGLGNIFKSIGNLLQPVLKLFGALLPSTSSAGSTMYNLTNAFYEFTVMLEKVTSSTTLLNPVFEALGNVVGAVFGAFMDLVGLFAPLGSALLGLVGAIGEVNGGLGDLSGFSSGIGKVFDAFNQARLAVLEPFVNVLTNIILAFKDFASGALDAEGLGVRLRAAFGNFGDDILNLFDKGKNAAMDLIAGLRSGLTDGAGGMKGSIQGFVQGFVDFFKGLLGINSPSTVFMEFGRNIVEGLVEGIKSILSTLGDAISSMVSFIGDQFSEIDKFDLANLVSAIFGGAVFLTIRRFMNAISGAFEGFGQFGANINDVLEQTTSTMKTVQTGIKAKALLNIALAIGVLAASLWLLSKIPADKLAIGLGTVGALLAGLTATMNIMAKNAATTKTAIASLTAMAFAMTLMATAILILSAAVLAFGNMGVETLAKGLTAVAVALGILSVTAIVLSKAAPSMFLASAGILLLAVALTALAPAILIYSKIPWPTLFSGIFKMAAALVILGIAMIPLSAMAPLVLIAAAALVVLAAGLTGMLAVITLFNTVSWGTIMGGVAKIGVALIVLGAAAGIAAIPLAALGIAMLALGAGFFLFGAGLALAGVGIAAIAAAGTAAAAVLVTALSGFLSLLPLLAVQLVAALRTAVEALAQAAPEIVDGLVTIGTELLRGIAELSPKIVETAITILTDFVNAIVDARLMIFNAAIDLIEGFIQALRDRLPNLIQAGTDLLVGLITGIGAASAQLVTAAGEAILNFLNAVNTAVTVYLPQILAVGRSIATNLVLGLVQGLIPAPLLNAFTSFVDTIVNFFRGLLGINSPSTVFAGFGRNIVEGLANGIRALFGLASSAISGLVSRVVGIASGLPGKVRAGLSSLGGILKNLFTSAFNGAVSLVKNGVSNIGSAISRIPGILKGIVSSVGSAAKSIGSAVVNGIKNGLGAAVGAVGNLASTVSRNIKSAINSALNLPLTTPNISIKIGPKSFGIGGKTLIPRFAKGVTGFGGGTALVGEVGPELVTMGRGANVITNKSLAAFMKQVNALTKVLTSGSGSQNSPGGAVSYVVSADFKGDPKRSGTAFAANIAAGLINGLKANQGMVNTGMASMATGLSNSFAEVLQINSPSRVFQTYAKFVGQGFINGLVASVDEVKKAAAALGNASILAIAKTITDGQLKLEAIRGKANAYSDAADELRAKARRTKSKKARKRLEAEARALDKKAKQQAAGVAAQAKRVAAENEAAERAEQYKNADTQGKADMKKEDAAKKAQEASAAREQAIRLKQEANLIRKRDKKRAKELDKQAAAALARSKTLADTSERYALEASQLTEKAKQEAAAEAQQEQQSQIQSVTASDVAAAQAAFDAYTRQLRDAEREASLVERVVNNNFEQNNYSPEAISPADAYRNGKSLVSLAEKKLAPTG